MLVYITFLSPFPHVPLFLCARLHMSPYFYAPVSRRAVLCDWVWRVGGRPHRFPHNNFSSVYRIFTKLGHMILLWKGKNPIYFGVIRSKVKVTITINRICYRLIIYIDGCILWCTHFLFTIQTCCSMILRKDAINKVLIKYWFSNPV
jgi:hypothetical protein